MAVAEKEWEYNGKKYIFTMPTIGQSNAADLEYSKSYTEAIKNGLMPRVVLERDFKEKGIWTEKDDQGINDILAQLQEHLLLLRTATTQEDKEIAKENLLRVKIEYQEMYTKRTVTFQHSADSKGEAARILELAWRCILDGNKQPVWKTKDDFLSEQDSKFIGEIIKELVIFTNGLEEKINSLEDFIEDSKDEVKISEGSKVEGS